VAFPQLLDRRFRPDSITYASQCQSCQHLYVQAGASARDDVTPCLAGTKLPNSACRSAASTCHSAAASSAEERTAESTALYLHLRQTRGESACEDKKGRQTSTRCRRSQVRPTVAAARAGASWTPSQRMRPAVPFPLAHPRRTSPSRLGSLPPSGRRPPFGNRVSPRASDASTSFGQWTQC
jgi:hypothetical protein